MGLFRKKKKSAKQDENGFEGEISTEEPFDNYEDPWESSENGNVYSDGNEEFEDYDTTKKKKKKKKADLSGVIAIFAVILIIGLLYLGFAFIVGPKRGNCKEVITEFQSSINTLDDKRFLAVLEPEMRRNIQVIFVTSTGSADTDLSLAFSQALDAVCSGLMQVDSDESLKDTLNKMEVVPVNYGLPGMTRNVKCKVRYGDTEKTIRVSLQKYEGECLIKSVKILDK